MGDISSLNSSLCIYLDHFHVHLAETLTSVVQGAENNVLG
jgi:hypothetical protein